MTQRGARVRPPAAVVSAMLAVTVTMAAGARTRDGDRDGLADKFEQQLLERFQPELVLSSAECDGLPAEFARGASHPLVAARSGVLYGQVFRRHPESNRLELRYYHLWARDCGRAGHALDVERVSALVSAPRADSPARQWRAGYWYAAGHEHTICDRSTAARAEALNAVERGPRVWVSAGKHASYLDPAWCSWGCGADRCAPASAPAWRARRVLNLGERGAPLHDAAWTRSSRWSLAEKMGAATDFPPELVAALDRRANGGPAAGAVLLLRPELRPAQSILMAGSEAGAALAESSRRTGAALKVTDAETSEALAAATEAVGASLEKTGRALKRSARGVARFLGSERSGSRSGKGPK